MVVKIIAEISGNHNGDFTKAIELIHAAKECGCDMVKIQTYEPEDMNDPVNNALYEKYKIPRHWFPALFGAAKERNIILFSSVFAPWAVEFLQRYDCPVYKLASPESTRLPMDRYYDLAAAIRKTGKEFWASTGQMDFDLIAALKPNVLMYCKAGYPAGVGTKDIEFAVRNKCSGFSDHTSNIAASLAMMNAGIRIIERHFKLDDDCIDFPFSFNPKQMARLCKAAHA